MGILLSLLAFWPLFAASPEKAAMDAHRLARIPERMKVYVDKGAIAGVVTLVQRHGAIASIQAAGWQDLERKVPMRDSTIFEVMSMTKPVTATGIMLLMEEGRLSLSDPVERHLPEFRGLWVIDSQTGEKDNIQRVLKRPSRAITIRDLLTHTSGMPEMPPDGMSGGAFYRDLKMTLADAVRLYSQQPLSFQPGTKWSYSNTGMATLGRIIEVVGGQPYEQFLDERIFRPLGMRDSFFFPPAEKHDRIAAVYERDKGKLKSLGDGIYRKDAKYPMPEGGLYSTASDLAAFYQMMLNGGVSNGRRILSRATVDMMTDVHTADVKSSPSWGLGWSVAGRPGSTLALQSLGSFGHGGAFGTYGWIDPKKDIVGVFLIQRFPNASNEEVSAFEQIAGASIID